MSVSLTFKSLFTWILSCFMFLSIGVAGQNHDHEHDDDHHLHDVHKYHLGVGVSGAYLTGEQILAPGIDLHLLRQLGEEQNWGLGLGYEVILKENIHNNISLIGNYHAGKYLAINAGPGITFSKHDGQTEVSPALHAEAVLEFDVGRIHIGPVAGFGLDKDESHFSLGVHVGYGF